MIGFYQNIITDKSFQILKNLSKNFNFVLIGGWAVYFYTKKLKSKDIDLIVNFDQLEKLKKTFEISKNDRLKKYEVKLEEVDIDIYLPFYSKLGIPVEKIIEKTINKEGFILPQQEILLITKLYAFSNRKGSIKGEKDKIDILSLFIFSDTQIDFFKLKNYFTKYHLNYLKSPLKEILINTKEVKELNLNQHQLSKKKKIILNNLF